MQYFGGKARISKQIAEFIQPQVKDIYWEPFCGSCWVLSRIKAKNKVASDANLSLIYMWKSIQEGWEPPVEVSESEYKRVQQDNRAFPLKAFIGFGCSFAGKWFGGYARGGKNRNYAQNAYNSLMKKKPGIIDTEFLCGEYDSIIEPQGGWTIYCDPPYEGTTEYGAIGEFDSEKFWAKIREWAKNNTVFVSEYSAPDDFEIVWKTETKTDIRTKVNGKEIREERIYVYKEMGA